MTEYIQPPKPACLPPFSAWLSSNIPAVYDNTMSYYEELTSLIKYLEDQILPALNTDTEAIAQLQELLTELKKYVDDYFKNLDVQEEINNKLDEMAEDGTLQEIITAYIQQNVTWTFDTVADMKQATNLISGSYARTLGYHSVGDGGASTYLISDSGTANEMDVIAVDELYAILQISLPVIPEQLGAYGDDTNDDQEIINYAITTYKNVKLNAKTYLITEPLIINGNEHTISANFGAVLHYTGNEQALCITDGSRNKISDIKITGNNSNIGIEFSTSSSKADTIIERCYITNVATGLKTTYLWDCEVKNTRIISTNTPMLLGSQTNNVCFTSCYFTGFQSFISLTNCEGIEFNSCDIANFSGSGECIRLYQSSLTLINCYYEGLGTGINIRNQETETSTSSIVIIGGKGSYNETTFPSLNIDAGKGKLYATNLQKMPLKVVAFNMNGSDKAACGYPIEALNLPDNYTPSMFKSISYFDGTFDVTYTRTNTSMTMTQTFDNGYKSIQYPDNTNQGIRFSNLEPGKDYLIYIDGETPTDTPNLVFRQNGVTSGYTRSYSLENKRMIIPVHFMGTSFDIFWGHSGVVKIRNLIIVEA